MTAAHAPPTRGFDAPGRMETARGEPKRERGCKSRSGATPLQREFWADTPGYVRVGLTSEAAACDCVLPKIAVHDL